LTWLHLPVPHNRSDTAYFVPMRKLRLPDTAELYLGLVHHTDAVKGALERVAAARQVALSSGLRRSADWVAGLRKPCRTFCASMPKCWRNTETDARTLRKRLFAIAANRGPEPEAGSCFAPAATAPDWSTC